MSYYLVVILLAKLIAHRGKVNKYTMENTLDSIKNAFDDSKYIGVEFDIRVTKDQEFIVFHNPTFNNKLISETMYNELPKYVPRLKDVLKINTQKIFLIELKNINNLYSKFRKILAKYTNKNIYIMSFSNKIMKNLITVNRTYKIGILNYILNTTDLIQEIDFIAILNSLINEEIIAIFKDKEIFSYGLFEHIKYENIYYIVDAKE